MNKKARPLRVEFSGLLIVPKIIFFWDNAASASVHANEYRFVESTLLHIHTLTGGIYTPRVYVCVFGLVSCGGSTIVIETVETPHCNPFAQRNKWKWSSVFWCLWKKKLPFVDSCVVFTRRRRRQQKFERKRVGALGAAIMCYSSVPTNRIHSHSLASIDDSVSSMCGDWYVACRTREALIDAVAAAAAATTDDDVAADDDYT